MKNANEALEDSMDTRQDVKQKLSMCKSRGDLATLEKTVKELSVVDLNRKVSSRLQSHDLGHNVSINVSLTTFLQQDNLSICAAFRSIHSLKQT